MKKPLNLLLGVLTCLLLIYLLPVKNALHITENEREEFEEEEEEKSSGVDKQLAMWFWARGYPDPSYLNEKFTNGWKQAKTIRAKSDSWLPNTRMTSGSWSFIGPTTPGGRILSIAIDPNNVNNVFIGSAGGGIWKTTNGGTSWSSVNTDLNVLGVPTITFHPTSSSIILAGTGEVYRTNNSNIGYNVWKARGTYGIGIIRSANGGASWTQVFNKNFSDLFGVLKIKFDPNNPNNVYACTTAGVYKSTDAGATWGTTPILNKIYTSDIAINPSNSNIMVVSVGNLVDADKGIYRTTNGGSSWTKITGTGFPSTMSGWSTFAYVSSTFLYASVGMNGSSTNELYMSKDFGATWVAKSNSYHTEYQFWCAHTIAVNPSNENDLVMGGVDLYRYTSTSTTGSAGSSTLLSTNSSPTHDDYHDVKFIPGTGGDSYYLATDGGMYKITGWNSSPSYTRINTGLGATQFYASIGVSANPATPNNIIGGLQDNGVWVYSSGTTWNNKFGGDGGACAIAPSNNNIALASNDALTVKKSTTTGTSGSFSTCLGSWAFVADDRTAFMAPIAIAKSDPTRMYAASDNLHVSSNTGGTWTNSSYSTANKYIDAQFKTAITLAVSPTNKDKLYISTSPFSQKTDNTLNVTGTPDVFVCTNGGAATPTFTSIKPGLPDRFVMDFAIHPTNDNIVYVALGGYGSSHIFRSGDGGATWTDRGIGGVLPDVPFNAIFVDPVDPNYIYAGSDLGVYVSPNQGINWYDYNNGLPDVAQVFDIQQTSDNMILLATHGRGAWKSPKALPTLPVNIVSFTGTVETGYNQLQWIVGQEMDVSNYEVERSFDGHTFNKIGSVRANNSPSYTYKDVLSNIESYYYRLKMIDKDGTYKYSDVIYLKRDSKKEFHVMNNPFQNDIRIQFSIPQNSKGQINLYDAAGKLVRKESLNVTSGQSTYTMNNLSTLPTGAYFIEAIINNQRWKQKLLKK